MAKRADPEHGWYSAADIALIFDWSVSYFNQSVRPILPPSAVRSSGRRATFRSRAVLDLLIARQTIEEKPTGPHAARLAAAKAEQAEIGARIAALDEAKRLEEQAIRHGRLIEVADLEEVLRHIVATLEAVADEYATRSTLSGEDAQEMLNRALSQLQNEAEESISV